MGIDLGTIHNTVIYNGYSMLDCPGIFLANDIWVCLKLGYTPKIAILKGKIMINRGTHGAICSDKPTWESNLAIPYVPWC